MERRESESEKKGKNHERKWGRYEGKKMILRGQRGREGGKEKLRKIKLAGRERGG